MTPDIRQLECFVAVAEEGHVGRAAVRLHMTQPPLTRRIRRLERDLGVQLFEREPTGMRLTSPGAALLGEARRILALAERAVTLTRRVDAGESGTLLVGYFGSTVFSHVPRLLAGFRAVHPDIELTVERVPKVEQVEALRDGLLHIGFGRLYHPEDGIEVRELAREPLLVAVPERWDVAGGEEGLTVGDLAQMPMVLYPRARPSFADQVIQLCEAAAGRPPTVVQEASDVVGALTYVALGSVVAIVPRTAGTVAMPGVAYLPLAGDATVEFNCVFPSTGRPPALDRLIAHLGLASAG